MQGGEFGTADLFRQRQRRARAGEAGGFAPASGRFAEEVRECVQHDPKTQERIAREVFGMVRGDKEIVYRFAEPRDTVRDTVGKPSAESAVG